MQMNSVSPQLSGSADLAVRLVLGLLVLSVLVLIVYQAISFFAGEKGRKLGSRKFWMAAANLIILLTLLAAKGAVEGLLQYVGNVIGLLLPFLEPGWPAVILVGLFYTCLATLSLVFFVQLTGAFYWWSKELVEALIRKIELIPKLQVPSLQVHIFRGLRFLIDGFRFVMIAIGLLVFFPLVFHFFPRTASFMKSIEEALGTPAREIGIEILEYIPNLGYLLIILALGWVILRLMRYLFESVQAETLALPGFDPEWAMPTYKVGRAMLLLFLLMVGFPYLPGAGSRFFQGFSLFVGALLTLGGASAIGNILSGVILTYTGGFRLGDRVSIGETTGKVVQKSLLVTRVQTNRNITVTIPNTTVVSSPVLNYTKEAEERVGVDGDSGNRLRSRLAGRPQTDD